MDLSDPIGDVIPTLEGRVLQVLARTDLPLSGSRVAAFIPSATREGVRLALNRLVRAGLVNSRPSPPAVVFSANRRHLLWPAVARLVSDTDQIVHLLKTRIVEMTARQLADASSCTAVALFGSVARGEARPDSDVDLLVVTPDEVGDDAGEALVAALIDEVQAATGNQCNVYAVRRRHFDDLIRTGDPMIASWDREALTVQGPDIRRRIRGATWDDA